MRLALLILLPALLLAQPLPLSTPEKEGLSSVRLARLHDTFDRITKSQQRPGAITMIVRNGRIADWRAYGLRDVDAKLPMEKDTLCRIYSMTKPITSVAVMMLVEEGKLTLADRVDKFIPEFKALKRLDSTEPARPMTVKHLLTHTSGLTYGFGQGKMADLYREAKVFDVDSLKGFIGRMASLPLVANPGEKYEYSVSTDVLGYLVEVVSQMPFDRFVQERILTPLKMTDTHFEVPAAKRPRVAKIYSLKDGKLTAQESAGFSDRVPFGGMGLHSTIGDYARFAQMLVNGGTLDHARLLSRKTVELMMMNHLTHLAQPTIGSDGADGFGLGGSVRVDPAKSGRPGSQGLWGWGGAASTYFRVDPKEKMAILLFMQWLPTDSAIANLFETLSYQALE